MRHLGPDRRLQAEAFAAAAWKELAAGVALAAAGAFAASAASAAVASLAKSVAALQLPVAIAAEAMAAKMAAGNAVAAACAVALVRVEMSAGPVEMAVVAGAESVAAAVLCNLASAADAAAERAAVDSVEDQQMDDLICLKPGLVPRCWRGYEQEQLPELRPLPDLHLRRWLPSHLRYCLQPLEVASLRLCRLSQALVPWSAGSSKPQKSDALEQLLHDR